MIHSLFAKYRDNFSLLLRFILPYLLVIAIPLFVGYAMSQYMINTVKEDVLKSYSMLLRNNVQTLEGELGQMEDTVGSIILNPSMESFFMSESHAFSELLDVKDSLNAFHVNHQIIKNIYLYNNTTDTVVDKNGAYLSAELFYLSMEKEFGDYSTWTSQMMDRSWKKQYIPVNLQAGQEEGLIYTQSVPLRYVPSAAGKVNVLLNTEAIIRGLEEVFSKNEGGMCIIDDSGQVLLEFQNLYASYITEHTEELRNDKEHESVKINEENMFLTTLTMPRTGWHAVFILPQRQILARVKITSTVIYLINMLTLVAGIIVSLWLTKRKARDFREVIELMDGNSSRFGRWNIRDSEYTLIKRGVTKLVSDNKQYRSQLDAQREHMNDKLLDKIIHGSYESQTALDADLKQTKLPLMADSYILILLQLGREYRLELNGKNIKEFVCEQLYAIIEEYIFLHNVTAREIAVLIPVSQTKIEIQQHFRTIISKIRTELSFPYHIEMTFGIGEPCAGLLEISTAYSQAKTVINYNLMGYGKEALWYHELPKEEENYFYPMQTESRLYNYAMVGNQTEVESIIDHVYHENFVKRKLSVQAAAKLMDLMEATVSHICEDANAELTDLRPNAKKETPVTERFDNMNKTLQKICLWIRDIKSNEVLKAGDKMIRYVDEHFTDEELSLAELSVKFQLNEKYVSALFKEQLGVNFLTYVEGKRIDLACLLIAEGTYKITEIAKKVGYSSDGTFRRAFKRNKNMSPSAYVQQQNNL